MSQQSVEELSAKLREYRSQLKSVEDMLLRKSGDETLLKLRDDLKTVIELTQDLYRLRVKQDEAAGVTQPKESSKSSSKVGELVEFPLSSSYV